VSRPRRGFARLWAPGLVFALLCCTEDIFVDDLLCPGHAGPEPVRIDGVCVDRTEVTKADYAAFLADGPSPSLLPPECHWKADHVPGARWPPTAADGDHPVVGVDWCDAHAYCAWAGKRLCGRIGGGTLQRFEMDDPEASEWHRACTFDGTWAYPYGDDYDPDACVTHGSMRAVASAPGCEGGYPGLFDLIGNVWEWEDACDVGATSDADLTPCSRRGAANTVTEPDWHCGRVDFSTRRTRQADMGFRCCG
jgi:formylglycine-generating enzyme